MISETSNREDFLMAFIRSLGKSMIDAGMIPELRKYPDIEKIKENIKIYEKPESTFANAIIMNQSQDIKKLMQPYESTREIGSQDVKKLMQQYQSTREINSGDMQNSMLPYESTKEVSLQGANIASIMELGKRDLMQPLEPQIKPINEIRERRTINTMMKLPRPRFNLRPPGSQLMPDSHKQAGMRTLPSMMKPSIVQINPVPIQPLPVAPEKTTVIGLNKIDDILVDKDVQTIECPGPNKQILIYKNGRIQTANLTLTADEINNVMKDLSEKTRIPLMRGVFKAAIGNLVITSVMSEFVGTRFIIQKKSDVPKTPPNSIYQQ